MQSRSLVPCELMKRSMQRLLWNRRCPSWKVLCSDVETWRGSVRLVQWLAHGVKLLAVVVIGKRLGLCGFGVVTW